MDFEELQTKVKERWNFEKRKSKTEGYIRTIKSGNLNKIQASIDPLFDFIPEFSTMIINNCGSKLLDILIQDGLTGDIVPLILNFIKNMFLQFHLNLTKEDPYFAWSKHIRFMQALFYSIGDFNEDALMILKLIQSSHKEDIYKYILATPTCLNRMSKFVSNQTYSKQFVFFNLLTMTPEITEKLLPNVKECLKTMDITLAVDILKKTKHPADHLHDTFVENWVTRNDSIKLSTFGEIFELYPSFWQNPKCFIMIPRLENIESTREASFITYMKPQTFDLPDEIIQELTKFFGTCTNYTILYMCLYAFSLVKPDPNKQDNFMKKAYPRIFSLNNWQNEMVSIGVAQVSLIYMVKYGQHLTDSLLLSCLPIIFDKSASEENRFLHCALLTYLSTYWDIGPVIIDKFPEARFTHEMNEILLQKSNWRFPNMVDIDFIADLELVKKTGCVIAMSTALGALHGVDISKEA